MLSRCFAVPCTRDPRSLGTLLFLPVQKDISTNKSNIWVAVSLFFKPQSPSTSEEERVFVAETPLPLVFNLLQIE